MTDDEPDGKGAAGSPASQPPRATKLEIVDPERRLKPAAAAWLHASAANALAALRTIGELRVRIVGDVAMSEAHVRYGGEAGPTDVLTFDLSEAAPELGGRALDTDMLICADVAARQAAQRGHSPEHELLLYIVHGVLHCLGYDDHTEPDAAAMHAREDEVLAAIGIGPVYSTPAASMTGLPERTSV